MGPIAPKSRQIPAASPFPTQPERVRALRASAEADLSGLYAYRRTATQPNWAPCPANGSHPLVAIQTD